MLKTAFYAFFRPEFRSVEVRARQHDVEENFGEKILLLRQNATTPHNFTYQQICCFLLLQQKNVARKFPNNIQDELI